MRVYHGSLECVPSPEIRQATRTLDYGTGFYTTTSAQQAEEWVRKRMKDTFARKGFVNEYELDLETLKQFHCIFFESPTDEWIDFVMSKQNLLAELRTYDLVDQYLFHTEQALKALRFVKAKEILL